MRIPFLRNWLKSDWGSRMTTHAAASAMRALVWSLKMTWVDRTPMDTLYAQNQPFIFAYWHADLVVAARVGVEELARKQIVLMTSNSRDGRIIGDIMARQGMTIVSGSSRRGGMEALMGLAKNLRAGMNGSIAVDGPRGPRREVKEGIIRLAQMTGHPILPSAIGYRRCYTTSSWDRLRIPLPFTSSSVICGDPIFIGKEVSRDMTGQLADSLGETLAQLRQRLPYDRD